MVKQQKRGQSPEKRSAMKQYGFGIDVGGTTVKLGFFDQDTLMDKWEIPTNTAEGGTAILPDIARAVQSYLASHGILKDQVMGLGVGVPGAVLPNGVVNRCVNLGWGVLDIAGELGALTGLPVKAGNDANVAALGESWKGGAAGCRNVVVFTLGTGIGGGIILDGRILPGVHGAGGEVGHITMDREEREVCGCGNRGCAEQYGSATGIVRTARRILAEDPRPCALRKLESFSCKDIFDCAAQGDELAKKVLDRVFDDLGMLIAKVCCVVDPAMVVIGGGVSKAGQVLLDGIRPYYEKYVFHACRGIPFALATLGNDAGIYGAMKLAMDAFGES